MSNYFDHLFLLLLPCTGEMEMIKVQIRQCRRSIAVTSSSATVASLVLLSRAVTPRQLVSRARRRGASTVGHLTRPPTDRVVVGGRAAQPGHSDQETKLRRAAAISVRGSGGLSSGQGGRLLCRDSLQWAAPLPLKIAPLHGGIGTSV